MENKRTEIQRQKDLILISEMYLKGTTQQMIALKLGLSQSQISYDIKEIIEHWRETQKSNVADKIAIELEKINQIEARAWESFELSKTISNKKMKEVRIGKDSDDKTAKVQTTTFERYGNPKFLEVILQCSNERRKLLGLDAAVKLTVNADIVNRYEQMNDNELDNEIANLEAILRQNRDN